MYSIKMIRNHTFTKSYLTLFFKLFNFKRPVYFIYLQVIKMKEVGKES